jgi:hypothetical protein
MMTEMTEMAMNIGELQMPYFGKSGSIGLDMSHLPVATPNLTSCFISGDV